MRRVRVAALTLASVWAATIASTAVMHGAGQASIKEGVFTAAQAARGKALYQVHCITCHFEALNGTPPLAGEAFRAKWATLTVNDLYTKMHDTMPTIEPGSLEATEYIDIVTYILEQNKATAGANELKIDAALLKGLSLGDLPQP